VGSVASAEDAKVAAGLPRTGAERLLGKGDFLVVARGEQLRVQGAYASATDIRRAVARLQNRRSNPGASTPTDGFGRQVMDATQKWVQRLPVWAGVRR
jgi:DNA segregation ATPase FtsK/SpoIIIE-like protein